MPEKYVKRTNFWENLTPLGSSHLEVFLGIFWEFFIFSNSNLNFEFGPVWYRPKPELDRTGLPVRGTLPLRQWARWRGRRGPEPAPPESSVPSSRVPLPRWGSERPRPVAARPKGRGPTKKLWPFFFLFLWPVYQRLVYVCLSNSVLQFQCP